MTDALFVLVGVLLLAAGGEALVRGSLAAARRAGVTPLLSGLVIVGFGTSAPELAVSVDAAMSGRPELALGNIVGSNIGNILLILGVCALITPLAVHPLVLWRDAATVVVASGLVVILMRTTALGTAAGLLLLVTLVAYLLWAYWSERYRAAPAATMHRAEGEELQAVPYSLPWIVAAVVAGLALLIVGSQVLLAGALGLADHLGVPEAVVGLTLVAVGTSLPELSISVIAALRRHADVAVGNILGSNIFNLLGVLGLSALVQPLDAPARMLSFDLWVMLGTALLLLFMLLLRRSLGRIEGAFLLAGYGVYIVLGLRVFGG